MKTTPDIRLSAEERRTLQDLIRKGSSPARVHTRARILLLAAERSVSSRGGPTRRSHANQSIAELLHISAHTVARTRQRFAAGGLDAALYDQPRSGRPVEIDGAAEAKLVMLACSDPPAGHSRWTLQLLADRMVELGYVEHISDTEVHKRLKKQTASLEGQKLVRPAGNHTLHRQDGRCAGRLPAALRSPLSGGVPG